MNVARLIYTGTKVLNYPEKEVFRMTLRKFHLLYDEHLEMSGVKKEGKLDLDSVF